MTAQVARRGRPRRRSLRIDGRSSRRRRTFQLAANAEMKFPFDIQLKSVWYGKKPVRIDFTIEADEKLEFSIYRDLEIGTEDLSLDVKSHLDNKTAH